ncbi:4-hydroxy-2-oxoglutarate aldolase, 2-dehydro-3-deoxyphosphogluconate aldolase [Pseudonocardia sp. Ae717_Ps2]|uniref:bifunctional 4-hydroxy-2-oxoglutarate aldolase/2-dehydro-3-deoxy-phosphogluconate aldolase n=1 Tax=Pseudonocardia sp. Ae717_Ps2 TaxID=1885573 RepID=UPI000964C0A4|nr:bifunctional 4-hydroxy-2-oxoglutarate aldolase/2-dehydro-3-deoxy-phosphogluconate aldolase [Pseudonocardia sp. Ae717_Ps2]OLM28560.1 4-hydroxy-2-oxoglutarate aldolase, 2-dehydro-3-deoxyphosphogluconate aldolase [Pseudonocardia sp. Ae717_Ps2]
MTNQTEIRSGDGAQDTGSAVGRARQIGAVPIITLHDAADAVPLAAALSAGSIPCMEITLRTPSAIEALRAVRQARPDILLAAGTVLTIDQLAAVADAGVDLVVTPGLDPALVEQSHARGIEVLPGVATPTEIQTARSLGLQAVKFFPAEALGGARTLTILADVYPDLSFVPSGSITPALLPDYLRIPAVAACGGSWLVKPDLLAGRAFDRITALAADTARQVGQARTTVVQP